MPAVTTKTKGSVYVLKRHRNGRPAHDYNRPATWRLLEDEYFDLPDHVQAKFDAIIEAEDASTKNRRDWAQQFIAALDRGDDWLPRQRTGAVVKRDADWADLNTREIVLCRLWEQENDGATVSEIKKFTGVMSDGISGALSELTQAGIVVRLEETR